MKAHTKDTTGNTMMQKFTSLGSLLGVPEKLSKGIADETIVKHPNTGDYWYPSWLYVGTVHYWCSSVEVCWYSIKNIIWIDSKVMITI